MNFLNRIEETRISRDSNPPFDAFIPLHRRLFPIEQDARDIARTAVSEMLG